MVVNILRDPEGAEVGHFTAACQLAGKEVLEIGCGDGCLTWQYGGLPHRLIGIDPAGPELLKASSTSPASTQPVFFTQAIGEALPFPSQLFDVVLFASSL
jgi:ubiquinone/menaquinone biosynthesis C-methylase UbiE